MIQSRNGRAFEYAVLKTLYNCLKESQYVDIINNASLRNAENAYNELASTQRINNDAAAEAAIQILIDFEPRLVSADNEDSLHILLQGDIAGKNGDVRDVLAIRDQDNWSIGISCKHNHKAIKHCRLSDVSDFGNNWFNIPCSETYFNQIKPLFRELRIRRNAGELWHAIPDKEKNYYIPVLNSFIDELQRLDKAHPYKIPRLLVKYLLGNNDFYKIIADNKRRITYVQCFNLYGTLNKPAGNVKPKLNFQILKLPTKFLDISFKDSSKNTIIVTCDEGWSISMRIHNASSKVEPSLKYDVNIIGHPVTIYTTYAPWNLKG